MRTADLVRGLFSARPEGVRTAAVIGDRKGTGNPGGIRWQD